MAPNKQTIWTPARRAMGNLLPSAFVLPPMAFGVLLIYRAQEIFSPGLIWVAAGPVIGWVALNFLGLFQNSAMRSEMSLKLRSMMGGATVDDKVFVGMSSPTHSSITDPHQDVGFLILHDDRLEYRGELIHIVLKKREITGASFRANVHSLLGLGRWVAIDGKVEGKPVRLLVEPREKNTLLGNKAYGRALKARIEKWLKGTT